MAVNWSEGMKAKGSSLLARLRAETRETPSAVLQSLIGAGFTVSSDGDRLRVSPPFLSDDQRAKVKRHKDLLLRLVRPLPPADDIDDWRQGWEFVLDGSYRRLAAAWSPEAQRRLGEFVALPRPETEREALVYCGRLREIEKWMEARGELVPVYLPAQAGV